LQKFSDGHKPPLHYASIRVLNWRRKRTSFSVKKRRSECRAHDSDALDAEAERVAGIFLRVVADLPEDFGITMPQPQISSHSLPFTWLPVRAQSTSKLGS